MAEDGDRVDADRLVDLAAEEAPRGRAQPERGEVRAGDARRPDARATAAVGHVGAGRVVGGDVGERVLFPLQVPVHRVAEDLVASARLGAGDRPRLRSGRLEVHQPLGSRHRQRGQHVLVVEGIDRRVRSHREGERKGGRADGDRSLAQRPPGQPDVDRDPLQLSGDAEAAFAAAGVLHLLSAAEMHVRASTRLPRGHAGTNEVGRVLLEVEANLFVERILVALPAARGCQEGAQAGENTHRYRLSQQVIRRTWNGCVTAARAAVRRERVLRLREVGAGQPSVTGQLALDGRRSRPPPAGAEPPTRPGGPTAGVRFRWERGPPARMGGRGVARRAARRSASDNGSRSMRQRSPARRIAYHPSVARPRNPMSARSSIGLSRRCASTPRSKLRLSRSSTARP